MGRTPRAWTLVVVIACGLPPLCAQQVTRNPSTSPEDVAAGGRIFRSHCAECHGLKGEGGRGPNITLGEFRHGSTDAALFRTISRGIPGSEMPGIYFTDHQVWQIVAFVRSLSERRAPRNLPGDPSAGLTVLRGKGGCLQCHMVNGEGGRLGPDLSDIGAARTPEHLKLSLVDPGKEVLPRWWTFRVTVPGGKPVSGFRLNEDTYSIQLLEFDGNLLSLTKNPATDIHVIKSSTMPSYRNLLSDKELDDVVAGLTTLRRKARP